MARKMSKAVRMEEAVQVLTEDEAGDIISDVEEALEKLREADEARTEASDAFQEAFDYHEAREWEDRDSALESANEAVERMDSALNGLDQEVTWNFLGDRMEQWTNMVSVARDHLDEML